MNKKLYVHSIPINSPKLKKIADLIGISRYIPIHTFATVKYKWENEPTSEKDIYWYCAGDFRTIPQYKLSSQKISDYYPKSSTCLVAPNIKWGDHLHYKVIDGIYSIHYVCHNITNRILYSNINNNQNYIGHNNAITIASLHSIDITGYKIIVLSHLGVYGSTIKDWSNRIEKCLGINPPTYKHFLFQCVKDEILRLHFRACTNTNFDYREITNTLSSIDSAFSQNSNKLYIDFETKNISAYEYNNRLYKIIIKLLKTTEQKVGLDLSFKIYGITSTTFEEAEIALQRELNTIISRMKNTIMHLRNRDMSNEANNFNNI